MSGCNYSFIIEKEPFIEWMTATGIANEHSIFEERDDCKCLFQGNTVLLKILDQCKWPPKIMAVPLKCMSACTPLK